MSTLKLTTVLCLLSLVKSDVTGEFRAPGKNIEVLNSCSFDLDIGVTGGYAGIAEEDGKGCGNNRMDDGTGRCFWSMDIVGPLKSGESRLENVDHKDGDVVWSGNLWGTKHIEKACPEGGCDPWVGPTGIMTRAEFTLMDGDHLDYFDVSLIDGASVSMSMTPMEGKPDGFYCGTAGECAWEFDFGENNMYMKAVVETEENSECESDEECSSGLTCGVTYDTRPPTFGVCGKHDGWSTAHYNSVAGSTGFPFYAEKHGDLYGCSGIYSRSGYNTPEGVVCGCTDFEELGLDFDVKCINTNPEWEKHVLPWLLPLKKGCTTAYVFAFDDGATYTCKSDTYVIEFCPGNSEKAFFVN